MAKCLHLGLQERLHTRLFPKSQCFHIFNGAFIDHKLAICIGLLILISWNKLRNNIRPYRYLIGKYFIFVKHAAKIQ